MAGSLVNLVLQWQQQGVSVGATAAAETGRDQAHGPARGGNADEHSQETSVFALEALSHSGDHLIVSWERSLSCQPSAVGGREQESRFCTEQLEPVVCLCR